MADEVGDTVGQSIGLAGAGTGNDEQWTVILALFAQPVLDGQSLLGIERLERIDTERRGGFDEHRIQALQRN
jgi:hypothetical protein